MKYKKIALSVLFFVLFGTNHSFSQVSNAYTDAIAFELYRGKYMLVDTRIGDKTLKFYFDTGAATSLIDNSAAKALGITANFKQEVEGAGGAKTYAIALYQEVTFGHTKVDSVNLVFEDLTRLRKSLNRPFDGIIGYSLLSRYKTEIDFDKKRFYLYDFQTPLDLEGYESISFRFDNGIPIPQFDVQIRVNNEHYTGNIFFDSGAGLTLLVNAPFHQEHNLLKSVRKSVKTSSQNLSTESTSTAFLVDEVRIGSFVFHDFPIAIAGDKSGVSSYKGYLGILGAEIINRFNLVIDYQAMKLYLKPNSLYAKPFEQNLTGMKVVSNEENKIMVKDLSEMSPFYALGVREGDEILAVNGKNDLEQVRDELQREGKKVVLKYKRAEKRYRVKHRLFNILK